MRRLSRSSKKSCDRKGSRYESSESNNWLSADPIPRSPLRALLRAHPGAVLGRLANSLCTRRGSAMAHESCPKCGARKHQLMACPSCGLTRRRNGDSVVSQANTAPVGSITKTSPSLSSSHRGKSLSEGSRARHPKRNHRSENAWYAEGQRFSVTMSATLTRDSPYKDQMTEA